MEREFRFRAWHNETEQMLFVGDSFGTKHPLDCVNYARQGQDVVLMQYTGLKDKNGTPIFEGDIFRIEEDEEDLIFYVVIVWVQEWCMFATLRVDDEYQAYLNGGVKALDEPMFWTYTLEDTNSRKHYLCGNVWENPELINKATS